MAQLRLSQLRTHNFMRHDRLLKFGDVNYLVGGNGSGKSEVLEAISLISVGRPEVVQAHVDDVMLLAQTPDGFTLDAEFIDGPTAHTVRRRWLRDRETAKVTLPISGTMVKGMRIPEARGFLARTLGGWHESWTPLDLRSGGPALRKRLIKALGGGTGLRIEDYLPAEAPAYLRPEGEDEEVIDIWAQNALKRARDRVASRREKHDEIAARARGYEAENLGAAPDTTAIHERLMVLRAELAVHESIDMKAKEVERLSRQLEDARARLAKLPPPTEAKDIVDAEAALESLIKLRTLTETVEVQIASFKRDEAAARATMTRALGALDRHRGADVYKGRTPEVLAGDLENLTKAAAGLPASLEQWGAEELRAAAAVKTIREEHDAATAARDELKGVSLHFANCPACGADLAALVRGKLEAAEAVVTEVAGRLMSANSAYVTAQVKRSGVAGESAEVRANIDAIGAVIAWREAEAKHKEALTRVPVLPDNPTTAAHVAEARARLEAARDAGKVRIDATEAVDRIDLDLEVARAEHAAAQSKSPRPRADIDAEIDRQELALTDAGADASRVADYAAAVKERDRLAAELEDARTWVARMETAEGKILRTIAYAIERPCSELMRADVRVTLVSPRGDPDCRITCDGVDLATRSKGEAVLAIIAILRALGPTAGVPWRVIRIDGFECVEREIRPRVWAALLEAKAKGEIDQAFVCGCPDLVEAPEGVTVIRLSKAAA